MDNISAHAVRNNKTIEVTIAGSLATTCDTASVQDIYPGGSIQYFIDPGAAQVFVEEIHKTGNIMCGMHIMPWATTVSIPDRDHAKVEIFINKHEVLEVLVKDQKKTQFIVIVRTGTNSGCSVLPHDAMYPAIYSQAFGPASYEDCTKWITNNCGREDPLRGDE